MKIEYRKRTEMIAEDKTVQTQDIDLSVEVNPEDIHPIDFASTRNPGDANSTNQDEYPENPQARLALQLLKDAMKTVKA